MAVLSLLVASAIAGGTTPDFSANLLTSGVGFPFGVEAGDLNGDGRADIVVAEANQDRIRLFLTGPDGDLTGSALPGNYREPGFMNIADFDKDGVLDLVLAEGGAGTVLLLRNLGDATFEQSLVGNFEAGTVIDSADMNGDGDRDIVVGDLRTGMLSIMEQSPGGGFVQSVVFDDLTGATSVDLCDLNQDGLVDIVASKIDVGSRNSFVLFNRGGSFDSQPLVQHTQGTIGIACGDLDGDSDDDVLVLSALGLLNVLENTGFASGVLERRTSYNPTSIPAALELADINLDGALDVVVSGLQSANVIVGWNRSFDLTELEFTVVDEASGGVDLAVADINGDGAPDIASASALNQTVTVLRNNAVYGATDVTAFEGAWLDPELPGSGFTFDYLDSVGRVFVASFGFEPEPSTARTWQTADLLPNAFGGAATGSLFETSAGQGGRQTTGVGGLAIQVVGCDQMILTVRQPGRERSQTLMRSLAGVVGESGCP